PMPRGDLGFGGTRLPERSAVFSLADILRGHGPGGVWLTREDLFRELRAEYRKQAQAATARGDYRRAAFIYGKLLPDYRLAAAVLAQGGLPHQAALLYLKRLDDALAAAREFEAAGETDRALALYRQKGEHLRAGDLLQRLGEADLALAEYTIAADALA